MRKKNKKLIFFTSALSVLFLFLLFPLKTLAEGGGIAAGIISAVVGSAIVGPIAYAFLYLFQYVSGLFFIFGNYLTSLALKINFGILNGNEFVSIGWSIVRDVANLGFVLVIIIIALSTILRFQNYGAKALLPKLIAAAIIVNFSLAIAGVIIDFSHVLTRYFLKPIYDIGSDVKDTKPLVDAISGAFDPQNLVLPLDEEMPPPNPDEQPSGFEKFSTAVLLKLSSLFFVIVFTLVGALVMIAFAFMLLLRYIHLSFLLIIAPITWLFYVVPALSGQFKNWWNKFLDWVFFAPALSFFLYLALKSVSVISSGEGAVSAGQFYKGGGLEMIIEQGTKMILLTGFLIGGLIVAKKMGIQGAAGAIKLAEKGKSKAVGWAGKQGTRAGTRLLRNEKGQKAVEGLQKLGVGWGNKSGIRGRLGKFGELALRPVRELGGLASTVGIQQGENLIKQAEKNQGAFSDKQLALRINAMDKDQQIAALVRLTKNKTLNLIPNFASFIASNKTRQAFERYGKGKEYGDMEKTAGFNTAMLTGKDAEGAPINREKATQKFLETYGIQDYDKLQHNILSGFDKNKNNLGIDQNTHEEIRKLIVNTAFNLHPGAISKIRAKLKSEDLREFQTNLDDYIEKWENENLPSEIETGEKLKGITVPIKIKLDYIDKSKPELSNKARGLYNARKNFAGSLFGGFTPTEELREEKTT